jgi:hypothetical protein
MKMLIFIFLLSLQAVYAEIIIHNRYFKSYGQLSEFSWAPDRYQTDFKYDIFYYIPQKLKSLSKVNTLVFMHGGGGSTLTREGSRRAVGLYAKDMIKLAEEIGYVLIMPSTNGLNWGGHTRNFLKDILDIARIDLDIHPDKIGLAGHSMGGMGITRNYIFLADQYAFFLPMAAGMDERIQIDSYLNPHFNVQYTHLQGLGDHFSEFVTRCQNHLSQVKIMEEKWQVKAPFEMVFYQGSHNYDFNLTKNKLLELFSKTSRNHYQKKLWGSLFPNERILTENNIRYKEKSINSYFWFKGLHKETLSPERADFHAEIKNQEIHITFYSNAPSIYRLNLFLHQQMIDVKKHVKIYLDGKIIYSAIPTQRTQQNIQNKLDPSKIYTHYLAFNI